MCGELVQNQDVEALVLFKVLQIWFAMHTTGLQTAPAFAVATSGDSCEVQLLFGPNFSWFRVCGRFFRACTYDGLRFFFCFSNLSAQPSKFFFGVRR